ncbi:glycosyltransferase [Paramagnetospirillum caucaseum]|uniref:Glycosyltransferase n=1 Tax=Paramagnetospirillum caucaseum TaxID=1244869 RepID=M2Z437_9PROT|nr:glycosyltransferase family 2 protein [Paramagnetospirillum caucaseum]EME69130.1 glycosyltransferase [Paramagnetospirillum caucaseum]
MITVSIIVPAYNEERTIVAILERVKAVTVEGIAFEVIVVDDGSKDRTREILDARPDLYARFIKHSVNQGKGGAVKTALEAATGDFVLFQDADLEYDPADYVRLMKPLRDFDADVVMGSRFVAPEFTRVYYFWHRIGNWAISFLFNVLNNTTFSDIYSCYLCYRRSLVDPAGLRTRGWEQHAEILSKAVAASKVYYEVPISYHGRTYDEGKKIKAHHVFAVFATIIRERFVR